MWQPEHEEAYHKLKTAMINSPVMNYFDISEKTHVVVDASPVGLSAILDQTPPGKDTPPSIIAYASRALTPTEQRYSQTEREALAIVWGIEHFHLYLYGAPFTLHTDHKALKIIFGNPLSKPPARIERWLLRLQQYDFNVVYTTGSENPADFLSRHPSCNKEQKQNIADDYVKFLTTMALPSTLTLNDISKATAQDESLCALKNALSNRANWNDPKLKPFKLNRLKTKLRSIMTIRYYYGVVGS